METKVKRGWEGSCSLFVLPPFLFFPIYCSFLNSNPLPARFLLSSPHYSLLALHSHQFSTPIFSTRLSFTYCPRLPMIIIFLHLSSHLALRCTLHQNNDPSQFGWHSNRNDSGICAGLLWSGWIPLAKRFHALLELIRRTRELLPPSHQCDTSWHSAISTRGTWNLAEEAAKQAFPMALGNNNLKTTRDTK